MIVVSNTSPLIALLRIQRLDILKQLFGNVLITPEVLAEALPKQETDEYQYLQRAVNSFITVKKPKANFLFRRTIQRGERSVLNLTFELNADILIMDDRKARNEAKEMNLDTFLAYTTDILKFAEEKNIISSFVEIQKQLKERNIFLPEI